MADEILPPPPHAWLGDRTPPQGAQVVNATPVEDRVGALERGFERLNTTHGLVGGFFALVFGAALLGGAWLVMTTKSNESDIHHLGALLERHSDSRGHEQLASDVDELRAQLREDRTAWVRDIAAIKELLERLTEQVDDQRRR